jgi:hypothetical protein
MALLMVLSPDQMAATLAVAQILGLAALLLGAVLLCSRC